MDTTTTRRRRYATRAAAITATAAFFFGAAACGTETGSDGGQPAAPAAVPNAGVQAAPHTPMSADAAERWGASEREAAKQLQERYLRQLRRAAERSHGLKPRRSYMQAQGGREIPLP